MTPQELDTWLKSEIAAFPGRVSLLMVDLKRGEALHAVEPDAVVPAAITMVFTCIVRLIYLWGYAFSHNSNLTIAVIYPISWVLTSIAFLLYYKSRKWMPKGFHF